MTVTKLWKRKLVTKTISPDNQRVTRVDLAEKGRAELAKVLQLRKERFQTLFKAIEVTDQEREVMVRVCQRGVGFLDHLLSLGRASKQ
jgi:DNA-binding MarR family transcriptional regulator